MSETKLCPYCSEEIKTQAIKCKHCKTDLTSTSTDTQLSQPSQQSTPQPQVIVQPQAQTLASPAPDAHAVKGVNGQLTVKRDRVIISRKGVLSFMTQGLKGDKEIRMRDISSVQFKKAGYMVNGYIEIAFLGGREGQGGVFAATQNENSIMFNIGQQKGFLKAKELIDQYRDDAVSQSFIQPTNNIADQIEALANLKIKGIISEEEFSAKKKQLLQL